MRLIYRIAAVVALAAGSLVPTLAIARAQDPPADEAVLANAPLKGQTIELSDGYFYFTSAPDCNVWRGTGSSETIWVGKRYQCGFVNANGTAARFNGPTGLCPAPNLGFYVADTNNHVIRKVDSGRDVVTIIGTPGVAGTMTDTVNPSASMKFRFPQGVAGSGIKNFYIADTENHCIWFVNRNNGNTYLVAGEPGIPGFVNGSGRTARLNQPRQLQIDPNNPNILYFEDYGNSGTTRFIAITASGPGVTGCVWTPGQSNPCF